MKGFLRSLYFTKGEIRLIAFISAVLVAGYIIKNFREFADDAGKPYDYAGVDSIFLRKSLNRTEKFRFSSVRDSTDQAEITAGEIEAAGRSADSAARKAITEITPASVIDINSADKEMLETLPGIGEATAERIIMYREEKGKFRSPGELMNVKGIGKKKFEKLKPFIKASEDK